MVYVIRGDDIYIVAFGFDTPNYVQTVLPRPAILAVSGTATQWSGAFGGATSGTYNVEIVGRRTFRIGGTRVRAVGLVSRATYRGDSTGSRSTRTWLAIDRSLVIEESGTTTVTFGGDTERLSYHSRLVSLSPDTHGA